MTPLELQLLARIERRATGLAPQLVSRLLAAYRLISAALTDAELAQAVSSGTLDRALNELLNDQVLDDAFTPLRVLVDQAVLAAAKSGGRDLPSRLQAGVFDTLNPKIIQAARALDTRVIEGLKADVRASVIQHAVAGIEAGQHPRAVARELRSVLQLAPNQEQAIRNFRRMLQEGDREALTRALRDRRFDGTLQKAFDEGGKLSSQQIDTMAEAYRRTMVAFNAQTQARTVALDAQRAGQRGSWEEAVSRGVMDPADLRRTWMAVGGPAGDGHNRPEHLALHGTTVRFDEAYPNGEMVPGESTYGCRCFEKLTIVRQSQLLLVAA